MIPLRIPDVKVVSRIQTNTVFPPGPSWLGIHPLTDHRRILHHDVGRMPVSRCAAGTGMLISKSFKIFKIGLILFYNFEIH